ncbi:MAG: hypothetical protein HWE30_11275 [Methylocystaceae bacterium]|nr:hypothetical protein [Methylocystaceae bacterium]
MDIMVNGRSISVDITLTKSADPTKQKAQGTDFAELLSQQNEVKSQILEKGFGKYISDVQQEKLEKEIREKVLTALGLSEEQFNQLPAKQRTAIEDAIQEAIQQEMQARAEEESAETQKKMSGVTMPLVAGLSVS